MINKIGFIMKFLITDLLQFFYFIISIKKRKIYPVKLFFFTISRHNLFQYGKVYGIPVGFLIIHQIKKKMKKWKKHVFQFDYCTVRLGSSAHKLRTALCDFSYFRPLHTRSQPPNHRILISVYHLTRTKALTEIRICPTGY